MSTALFSLLVGLLSQPIPDADNVTTIGGICTSSFAQTSANAALQASAYDRPRDVLAALDAVLVGSFGPRICVERIAAIGCSFTAFPTLAAANGYDPMMVAFVTYEKDALQGCGGHGPGDQQQLSARPHQPQWQQCSDAPTNRHIGHNHTRRR